MIRISLAILLFVCVAFLAVQVFSKSTPKEGNRRRSLRHQQDDLDSAKLLPEDRRKISEAYSHACRLFEKQRYEEAAKLFGYAASASQKPGAYWSLALCRFHGRDYESCIAAAMHGLELAQESGDNRFRERLSTILDDAKVQLRGSVLLSM